MSNLYVDTHTHLWDNRYDRDREAIISSMGTEGIAWIVEVGTDFDTSTKAILLAEKEKNIYASVGVHPHDVKELDSPLFERLQSLAGYPKCVAIGEIGLDFYRNLSPQETQKTWFRKQIEWSLEVEKPLILHVREAYQETLDILLSYRYFPNSGVVHCFQSDRKTAERFIDLGFYIGLGGAVTYDTKSIGTSGKPFSETIASLPESRILSETDCPYLAPLPYRGRRNEPRYVKHVVSKIAEIRNQDIYTLATLLKENAERLFKINPKK